MAIVIVNCHNLSCKSLPEWERRGRRRELILSLYFIFCLSSLGVQPKAWEAFFIIMCPSTRGDTASGPTIWCNFNYSALILGHISSFSFPAFRRHAFNLHINPQPPHPSRLPSHSYPAAGLSRPWSLSRGTTDNVNHAACDWQLSKMAVAAHRGTENPFSGCTGVCPRTHLSAEKQEQRLSVTADLQSATRGTTWEGKRLKATQISVKINRWLSVIVFFLFF